ncbi:hypothetical protein GCM10010912_42550 [Paenibacillus albidus]|uniref:Adhesin domain-containing protein n=1 Tax=Paenibacillus albidus TaxID=2041023 RepID=A0A917FNH8_9BACL|nr:hypothetical protein [Paenibacillus albidus]GGF92989.1 hypothetical protein GCM10010912_42550 [Paenibacillus albidus]
MKFIKYALIVSIVLLVTACSGGEEKTATQSLELDAGGLTQLTIENKNGEIEVTGYTDSERIEVAATVRTQGFRMKEPKLELRKEEQTAYLDASFQAQFGAMGVAAVDMEIKIPRHLGLELKSHKDGKLRISDLDSSIKINNVNGHMEIIDSKGPLTIHNRDGDILVRNLTADLNIHNLNGGITVDKVNGSAVIAVGDGTLDIDHITGDVQISQSGNGEIRVGEVQGKVIQD